MRQPEPPRQHDISSSLVRSFLTCVPVPSYPQTPGDSSHLHDYRQKCEKPPYAEGFFTVTMPKKGLEPLPLTGHAPQTCASANSATWANAGTIGEKQYIGEAGVCQADSRTYAP